MTMRGSVVKVTVSTSDHERAMTSGKNSQSDSSESRTYSVNNNNNTNSKSLTGGGATGIELIVSPDSDSDDGANTAPVSNGEVDKPRSLHASGPRRGSLPDVMRLLPPIRDHVDSDPAAHQGLTAGGGSTGLRSARSSSPLLVLDRSGPGLCFRSSESEKMLPVLLNADTGLSRSHGLLSRSSHGGSSSSSGLGRPLSPRPPSPSLPHHSPRDKATKTAAVPHLLRRTVSEDRQRVSMDPGPLRRTLKPDIDSPLDDVPEIHRTMLRRRSCQSPNRLMFAERRRASEGVLTVPPSHLEHLSRTNTRTKLESRTQQTKATPSYGRKEVGELITASSGRKPKGKKVSKSPGLTRMSRLTSASLETVHRRDDEDEDTEERQRILRWLEGVRRGSDGSKDNEDLGVSELIPLSRESTETAIRVIHHDRD